MPPVRDAAVLTLSYSTVRLTWEPPGSGTQVVSCSYAILVRNLSQPAEQQRTLEPTETLACVVDGLSPDCDYEFTIKSTGILTSQISLVTLRHHTLEHVPHDAPRNVCASFETFTQDTVSKGRGVAQVSVTWEPPLKPSGVLLGYRISHRLVAAPASTPASIVVVQGATKLEAQLSLAPYELHEIRLLAFNRIGDGPWSTAQTVQTGTNVKRDTLARAPKKTPAPEPEPEPSWVRPASTPAEREALANRAEHNLQAIQYRGLMHAQATAEVPHTPASPLHRHASLHGAASPSAPPTVARTPSAPARAQPVLKPPALEPRQETQPKAGTEEDEDEEDEEEDGTVQPFVVSGKGTVRGVRDRVRQQLVHLHERCEVDVHGLPIEPDLYGDHKGRVVVYTSSCQAIRDTYEHCQVVRRIFYGLRFKVDMRDTFVSDRFNRELQQRLPHVPDVRAPQVFIFGKHIGGYKEIFDMNERHELAPLLASIGIERVVDMSVCRTCGSSGFTPCWWCQGDKKSVATMFDTTLRCTICEASGLVRCYDCTDEKLPSD